MKDIAAQLIAKAEAGGFDGPGTPSGTDTGSQNQDAGTSDGGQAPGQAQADSSEQGQTDTVSGRAPAGDRTRRPDGKFAPSGEKAGSASSAAPPTPGGASSTSAAAKPPGEGQQGTSAESVRQAAGEIDPDNEQTWQPEHKIDYKRFKTVIDQRNQHRSEAEQAQRQLAEYRQALLSRGTDPDNLQASRGQSRDQDVIEDIWGADAQQNDPVAKEVAELRQWRQQVEHKQQYDAAARVVDARIAEVRQTYPDVDEDLIFATMASQNLGADRIRDIAESWHERLNAVRQRAVRDYLAKNGGGQVQTTAAAAPQSRSVPPPRPVPAGSASNRTTGDSQFDHIKDPDQRKTAIREHLAKKYGH